MDGKELRAWRAPRGSNGPRRSSNELKCQCWRFDEAERGLLGWECRNLVLLEPQENSAVGSVLHVLVSFGYFIIDETDGLVRPSSPRAHKN